MDINDSVNAQAGNTHASLYSDSSNSDTLAKPSGTMTDNSAADVMEKMSPEVISMLLNMIASLISGLKPQSAGSSAFNQGSGSNNQSTGSRSNEMPSLNSGNQSSGSSSSEGASKPLLSVPAIPSLMGSGIDGAKPVDSAQESTRNAVTSSTSSNIMAGSTGNTGNTAASNTVFHVPPVPSLTGNSNTLPSVNANTTPAVTSFSANGGRTLSVNALPSLVSPTTGSLSTTDLPKAFNPPVIPSLTGGSSELPSVSASDNTNVQGLTTSATGASNSATASDTIFHVPAIPSLLGNGTLESLSSSLTSSGASSAVSGELVDNTTSNGSNGTGSHWT